MYFLHRHTTHTCTHNLLVQRNHLLCFHGFLRTRTGVEPALTEHRLRKILIHIWLALGEMQCSVHWIIMCEFSSLTPALVWISVNCKLMWATKQDQHITHIHGQRKKTLVRTRSEITLFFMAVAFSDVLRSRDGKLPPNLPLVTALICNQCADLN